MATPGRMPWLSASPIRLRRRAITSTPSGAPPKPRATAPAEALSTAISVISSPTTAMVKRAPSDGLRLRHRDRRLVGEIPVLGQLARPGQLLRGDGARGGAPGDGLAREHQALRAQAAHQVQIVQHGDDGAALLRPAGREL